MWENKKDMKDGRPAEFPSGPSSMGYASPSHTAPTATAGGRMVNLGQTIFVKGELTGTEDLTIDGRVEGKIELKDHNLTIGPNGKIKADLHANTIVIAGDVQGHAYAKERVEIAPTGRLNGDIAAPRITIADGAHFKGTADMERPSESARKPAAPVKSEEVRRIPEMKDDVKLQGSRL